MAVEHLSGRMPAVWKMAGERRGLWHGRKRRVAASAYDATAGADEEAEHKAGVCGHIGITAGGLRLDDLPGGIQRQALAVDQAVHVLDDSDTL